MSGNFTPFEHATNAELTSMRRTLLDAQQLTRTYGYNVGDRTLGEMLGDLLDERERRETPAPLTPAEVTS